MKDLVAAFVLFALLYFLCCCRFSVYRDLYYTERPVLSELSMGLFCVTRSNPTHQLTDSTQPKPLLVEKFGPNPTQSSRPTTNKFNCLVQPNLI